MLLQLFWDFFVSSRSVAHCVVQADLKFVETLLPRPPECRVTDVHHHAKLPTYFLHYAFYQHIVNLYGYPYTDDTTLSGLSLPL